MHAKLSISSDSSAILVDVENPIIFKQSGLRLALKDLGAAINDNIAVIPILDKEGLLGQYADIKDIFIDAGCIIAVDENANEVVQSMEISDREFLRSCQRARDVWDGVLETEDFLQFSKVVEASFQTRTLSNRQLLSAYHLAATSAACNFSVPGAGKTTIVLAAYAYLKSLPEDDPRKVNSLFVVGPMACFEAWETDFMKCFNYSPKSIRFLSTVSLDEKKRIAKGVDIDHRFDEIYLSHFQTFSIYESIFQELFLRNDRKIMFVIDEAHNIKGADGVWASSALRLAKFAAARVILTGTPAPNGYEDLKNLFDFIHPGREVLGFSRTALRLMSENKMSAVQLQEKSKPFFTRVRKKDLNIPPPIFKEEVIEMSPIQEKIYRAIESKLVPSFGAQKNTNKRKLFQAASLIRLRQAATNPKLLSEPIAKELLNIDCSDGGDEKILERINFVSDALNVFQYENDLPKLNRLLEIVKLAQLNKEKVLIWSYFVANIELITECLKKNLSTPVHVITGATPVSLEATEDGEQGELTREKILNAFRYTDDPAVLIATPQCLGESVSLHLWCHKAVYFDRDFNCGMFIQSKDRIHRFGLPHDTVTEYIYLTSKNSIDETISSRLSEKELRMNKLLDTDEIPLLSEDFSDANSDDLRAIMDSYAKRRLC
jgi:SNF2 family DNA or RNA helicase